MVCNWFVFIFAIWFNSSKIYSYWDGLNIISGSMMSGCANITILYAVPAILIVYLISIYNAFLGMFYGKRFAEDKWLNIVLWFYNRRLNDE